MALDLKERPWPWYLVPWGMARATPPPVQGRSRHDVPGNALLNRAVLQLAIHPCCPVVQLGGIFPKLSASSSFLEEKKFRSGHSRFAFHIVLSTDLTTFLWHKLLKLTYSKEARPKEDELQH